MMASFSYYEQADNMMMIIHQESLGERFFDLSSGYAGEILQKFSNYQMKLAIVGDFSQYQSKSLRDFIRECNRGQLISFAKTVDEVIAKLEVTGEIVNEYH